MTRLCCSSSPAGLALLVASGLASGVLVVANEADAAEIVPDWWLADGMSTLTDRFDAVVSWNEIIAPLHPAAWKPPRAELPMLTRLISARLNLPGPPDELVVESPASGPGRALAALVPDIPITVVAASPLVYGPATGELSTDVIERVTELAHIDLVPALRPLIVHGHLLPTVAVSRDVFLSALAPLTAPAAADALLLDEDWAARGVLTADEELDLHVSAVRDLVAAGHTQIVLAPDPAAGPVDRTRLLAAAAELGATLTVGPPGVAHQAWLAADPAIVVGTAAATLHLTDHAATIGTRLLLDRLRPYENPARIPVTIADACLPKLDGTGEVTTDPQPLIDAVAYCMRSTQLEDLREAAQNYVNTHEAIPHFRKKRLEALDLIPTPTNTSTRAAAAKASPAHNARKLFTRRHRK